MIYRFNFRRGLGQQGMSLMSLLMVLLAMSLAVTSAYFNAGSAMREESGGATVSRLESLRAAILLYRTHHAGANPGSLDDLVTATGPACTIDTNNASVTYRKFSGWCGPYIDQPIQQDVLSFKSDGWGTLIQLSPASLRSCGANRVCADGDDIVLAL